MIKQLIIDGKKSYDDFNVYIADRNISPPTKKTIKESVPFSNVVYDFSEINGEIYWEERKLEYSFDIAELSTEEMEIAKSNLMNWLLNVHDTDIYDPYIGNYHFHGSFESASWDEDFGDGTINVIFSVYPYKISNNDINIIEELGLNNIKTNNTTLVSSGDGLIRSLTFDGASSQETNATPNNPQDISVIESVDVKVTGKNLVNVDFVSMTSGGVTITNNGDGTISIKGTAEHDIGYNLSDTKIKLFKDKYYTQSVHFLSGLENECYIVPSFTDEDGNTTFNFFSNNQTKLIDKDYILNEYSIYIASGMIVDATLKFQLEEGEFATDWERYQGISKTIDLQENFIGLVGNVKDKFRLVMNSNDGKPHLYLDKYIGKVAFDGSENWYTWGVNYITEGITGFYNYDFNDYAFENPLLSNYFTRNGNAWGGKEEGFDIAYTGSKYIYFTIKNELLSDVSTNENARASFKTWLSENNVMVYYVLDTPYTIDLGIVEIPTYYDVTHLFVETGFDTNIEVGYDTQFNLTINNNSAHRITPTITSTGSFTIEIDGVSYGIGEGTYNNAFYLEQGTNTLKITGYGVITFSYVEELF